ncbi:putative mannose-6-phosphate isomerase [Cupriavidus sp. GA3-3]|uniref:cupin domain-containing protein n=1 Tax=Cupriavidus sp. GA3-3 TaxID=1229514 RepID=UPI00032F284A|nr:cupin domain-containing protein [Cupriavidus sp. GA3-3]EON21087.1 putative mannose-6-phosphate isomerase [Cupriavidus sp. GA3-3]
MTSQFVRRAADVPAYSPANHTGTANQRVIGRETVGARRIEVLLGTISRGHGALPHAHPNLEQASYLLTGEGIGEVAGRARTLRAGDWGFNPMGVFHRFEVVSDEPVQVMVVYAPPYSENPNAAVVASAADDPRSSAQADSLREVPMHEAAQSLPHYHRVRARPVITRDTVGARHLDIRALELEATGGAEAHSVAATEQVLFLQSGSVSGEINDQQFTATSGDWVFVPEGGTFSFAAQGGPCEAILVRAHDAVP